MPTVAYYTLGCKVNQYETERIRHSLEKMGFTTVEFRSSADAYIINTCAVTGTAAAKSLAAIRRALRRSPSALVVATGCCVEVEPDRIARIEGVGLTADNDGKECLPGRVAAFFEENTDSGGFVGQAPAVPQTRTRALVKVQDGCDHFCAYCVVRYARPRKVSRPLDEVVAEIRWLADSGYREIVLTGIRLGSYEHDGKRLPDLIRVAAGVEGVARVRVSSIEPWEVNDDLLEAMSTPAVCRHLHIPLQSGDDHILLKMGRPYASSGYRELISRIRERIGGAGITTDVMVGFPGETEAAFANTCELVDSVDFARLHVFRYSCRPRTRAAKMPDQVSARVKSARAQEMIAIGRLASSRFASSLIGQTAEVIAERSLGPSKHLTGYTDNYAEVVFDGDPSLCGQIVRVRIAGVDQDGRALGAAV